MRNQIGNKKFNLLAFADDIVLFGATENEIKEIVEVHIRTRSKKSEAYHK